MKTSNLNAAERAVLRLLAKVYSEDFGFCRFAMIARRTRLRRASVRLACRSLARKGLAEYARGLSTEDGEFAGAGYAATPAGCAWTFGR